MAIQTRPPIRRIDIDEVQERIKGFVFVDARSATALTRNSLRVPGAIHVQAKNVDEDTKRLPRDRSLVTYCTCSDERTSTRVARQLKRARVSGGVSIT